MKYYAQYKNNTSCDLPLVIRDPLKEFWDSIEGVVVRGQGPLRPVIMFIGMSPSKEDFEAGVPFSDTPGQKLIGIISYLTMNLKEPLAGRVYRTFLCPERNDEDLSLCADRLEEEIKLVNPSCLVFIGEGNLYQGRVDAGEEDSVIKIGPKYYNTFWVPDLRELFFKHEQVAPIMKKRLDHIIKELNNG